jgi:uroporphyrinogen decarboxylase
MTINSKQRVLATLQRQPVDRTPLDCWLYQRQFVELLEASYGSREQFLDEFGIDIFVGWTPYPNQFGRRFDIKDLSDLALADPRDPQWVSFDAWNPDFAGLSVTEAVEQQGDRRAIIAHFWGIVEGTSTFLGIEKCWANLRRKPDLMRAWFDRYADWLCGLADSCIDSGVDIMQMSDDWGSNQTMLFRPEMWRELIKPYAGRVISHIRSRGVPVSLHSDGYIMPIMDDLVEMGVAMLHPVQESAGMDPETIKASYGDKLVIYGSLDTVDALLLQEDAALADYIAGRFAIYAPGGGYIFNTGHMVQPDTPPQRLVGAYRLARQLAGAYGS